MQNKLCIFFVFFPIQYLLAICLKTVYDVEINDDLGTFFGFKEGHILAVIHKEVFGPNLHPQQVAFRGSVFIQSYFAARASSLASSDYATWLGTS